MTRYIIGKRLEIYKSFIVYFGLQNNQMPFSGRNDTTNPTVICATGYLPYSTAKAIQSSCKANQLSAADRRSIAIRDHWKKQDVLEDISKYAIEMEKNLSRSEWEFKADKRRISSRVQWEMSKVKDKMKEDLERRRNKLSELLRAEDAMYLEEARLLHREDPEEQQQRLLDRYKQLITQKELKRQKIAQEKKEQQFKRDCEELRTLVNKKLQKETAESGQKVILEKADELKLANREEKLYNELWRMDCEAKKQKEERDKQEKKSNDVFYKRYVADQIEAKKLNKIKKLKDIQAEADIMAEQTRLDELEDEIDKELKKQKQIDMKNNLEECLREKMKLRSQECQVDLQGGLSFIHKIMAHDDKFKQDSKKKALMKEQQEYLQYLNFQMKKELEFEKEVDRMYREELDRIWEKRQTEWEEEKEKRHALEKNVIEGVKEQIEANMVKSRHFQSMSQQYGQKILQEDEDDKRRNAEKLRLIRERNEKHQCDIINQMQLNEARMREEKMKKYQEFQDLQRKKEEEEQKIQKLLAEMNIDREHPYRTIRREVFNDCDDH